MVAPVRAPSRTPRPNRTGGAYQETGRRRGRRDQRATGINPSPPLLKLVLSGLSSVMQGISLHCSTDRPAQRGFPPSHSETPSFEVEGELESPGANFPPEKKALNRGRESCRCRRVERL